MKPVKFDHERAVEALSRFGYHSVCIDVPEDDVRAFAKEYGANVEKGFFNWMVRLNGQETKEERDARFEKIRQENHKRRSRNAARKKEKAQTK